LRRRCFLQKYLLASSPAGQFAKPASEATRLNTPFVSRRASRIGTKIIGGRHVGYERSKIGQDSKMRRFWRLSRNLLLDQSIAGFDPQETSA